VVLESWVRSQAYGVDPHQLRPQQASPERFDRALEENDRLLAAATPFLSLVHEVLADEPHIVALSDADGLILRLLAGPGLDGYDLESSNLWAGASWHERDLGCNGIGTCLAIGEPVILIGPEHFQQAYVGWTCIGAPIRDSAGCIIGALDLSVPNEYAHVHGWGWTLSLAKGIEARFATESDPTRGELERLVSAADGPLRSVLATFDLLATRLDISPSHSDFLTEARAELAEAERQWDVRVRQLAAALRERARAEDALAQERDFLEKLIDSIPVMVTVYDPAVQEIRLNPHVTRTVGWTNEDARQGDIMELCYPDPEYREAVRRFMSEPGPHWLDIEMTAKDGSKVPTTWANIRLWDDRQVGIGIDLTDRKRSEHELQAAYEASRRALQDHDHVVAVVSHDLRNPLSTLRMASALLTEDIPPAIKEQQLTIIGRSADQMTRLIDDLLEAARIEGGGLGVDPQPCRVDELVNAAVEQMRLMAEDASVRLRQGEEAHVEVMADPGRVAQVLGNLIGNAIRHTPEGSAVTVDAEVTNPAEVRISVRDSGPGIAESDIPHVFERYWQVRNTGMVGAGLGLAIARGIVEAHGGRIWVESVEGDGAVFHFTLPTGHPD
jgi:PAS domain S-box-containing protein